MLSAARSLAGTLTATVTLWAVAAPTVSFAETRGSGAVSADSSRGSSESVGGTSGTVAPRLEWVRESGAESCVGAAALRRMLEQVLGEKAAPSALGDSVIEGLVSKDEGPITWRARIRIVSSEGSIIGQRDLTTRQPLCSSLTPSVLLVLLMLVDPQAADRGLPAQVVEEISSQADAEADAQNQSAAPPVSPPSVQSLPPPPPAAFPPERAPSLPVSPLRDSRPSPGLGARVHLEPTLSVGLLPSATLGFSGGVSLVTSDDWQLALSGGYGGSARVDLEDPYASRGGIEFSALVADLSVCPAILRGSSVALSGCVGAMVVRRSTRTPALADHTNPSRTSLGPSATVETRLALTQQWSLLVRAGAAMPIPRERFVYQDTFGATRSLYTPSRILGTLGVGLGAEL